MNMTRRGAETARAVTAMKSAKDAVSGIERRWRRMSEELIKKSDAIKVAKEFWYKPDIAGTLAELPTIEPKRGEWIEKSKTEYKTVGDYCYKMSYCCRECSYCGYERGDNDPNKDTNFCPNCGADMRKGADDE